MILPGITRLKLKRLFDCLNGYNPVLLHCRSVNQSIYARIKPDYGIFITFRTSVVASPIGVSYQIVLTESLLRNLTKPSCIGAYKVGRARKIDTVDTAVATPQFGTPAFPPVYKGSEYVGAILSIALLTLVLSLAQLQGRFKSLYLCTMYIL